MRGLAGWIGSPPELQVVVYDCGLEIHLVGYDTDTEAKTAINSCRHVDPG